MKTVRWLSARRKRMTYGQEGTERLISSSANSHQTSTVDGLVNRRMRMWTAKRWQWMMTNGRVWVRTVRMVWWRQNQKQLNRMIKSVIIPPRQSENVKIVKVIYWQSRVISWRWLKWRSPSRLHRRPPPPRPRIHRQKSPHRQLPPSSRCAADTRMWSSRTTSATRTWLTTWIGRRTRQAVLRAASTTFDRRHLPLPSFRTRKRKFHHGELCKIFIRRRISFLVRAWLEENNKESKIPSEGIKSEAKPHELETRAQPSFATYTERFRLQLTHVPQIPSYEGKQTPKHVFMLVYWVTQMTKVVGGEKEKPESTSTKDSAIKIQINNFSLAGRGKKWKSESLKGSLSQCSRDGASEY